MPVRKHAGQIRAAKYIYVRAGDDHRFIGIWAVVVAGRVFVRSWNVKPDGWHAGFLEQKRGAIRLSKDGPVIPVRAVATRSERIKAAVDDAYADKYTSPANLKYVKGLRLRRRRDTTMELV